MKLYSAAAVTKTGRRRNNQDNFALDGRYAPVDHDYFAHSVSGDTSTPFAAGVFDGMGGESSGERASFVACVSFAETEKNLTGDLEKNKRLVNESLLRANDRLCSLMSDEGSERMGSTAIAVLLQDDVLYYTNLGDSRIYLMRDGRLKQITKDHTEGQSMVDAGVLTPEQLKKHPSRNKLSRHLGIFPEEMSLECGRYETIDMMDGDKLLLCSDGVFGVFEDQAMAAILSETTSPKERAEKLVDTAFALGSRDNMTAMVIDINSKPGKKLIPLIVCAGIVAAALAVLIPILIKNCGKSEGTSPEPESTELVTPSPGVTETADPATNPPFLPGLVTQAPVTPDPSTSEPTGTEQAEPQNP